MSGKDELVFLAKLAEQAERYEEMAEHMKKVAELGSPLSSEDRNLLSVAYKNVIGARRAAWRIVSSLEHKEASKEKSDKIEQTKNYREKIEKELMTICDEIINLLDETLIPHCDNSENVESSVFFYKMMGDYCRYKAEIAGAEARKQACEDAKEAYTKAQEIADTKDKELPNTHPIRLGLALNFSVFHYEIRDDQAKACELAKKAFDDAIAMLDTLDEESYKDSTLIMQLLRDNLNLWASDIEDADKEDIKVDDIEGDD